MRLYNNTFMTLIYKIKDIMVANGLSANNVFDSYPSASDLERIDSWPTVCIDRGRCFGRDIELGSGQWKAAYFTIDVFANSKTQRDEITQMIFDALNETTVNLYDFGSAFPATTGDYSLNTVLGELYFERMSFTPIEPPEFTTVKGEKFHSMIDGIVNMPNL